VLFSGMLKFTTAKMVHYELYLLRGGLSTANFAIFYDLFSIKKAAPQHLFLMPIHAINILCFGAEISLKSF